MRLELATQNDFDAIIAFYDDVTERTPPTKSTNVSALSIAASSTSTLRTLAGRISISLNMLRNQ